MPPLRHSFAIKPIPVRTGVGLKPEHFSHVTSEWPDIGFFEVHAENYMEAGGPPHHYLHLIRERYPLSVHGVGMNIGADAPLDLDHLERLKSVCDRYQPALVSEHLAWSTHEGHYLNDLLPIPYTNRSLQRVSQHINQMQEFLGRRILLENPSTYVEFQSSEMTEIEFLRELVFFTGCGLLLDVNNVFVAAINHGFDADAYIDEFPIEHVQEIHLGGHSQDSDDAAAPLLIDSHCSRVADPVWRLYARALARGGPKPTLIEWDNNVPAWADLEAEALSAEQRLGLWLHQTALASADMTRIQ